MKKRYLASILLVATGLLLYIAIPAFQRAATAKEMERAVSVLADCYRFAFADTMDQTDMGQPSAMPARLEDVPGWNDYVNKAEPSTQALCRRIDWHPPQAPMEGAEIASIDFPNTRAVVLQGGSAFAIRK